MSDIVQPKPTNCRQYVGNEIWEDAMTTTNVKIIQDKALSKKPTGNEQWLVEDAPRGHGRFLARQAPSGDWTFYYRYTAPGREQDRLPLGGYDPTGKAGLTLKDARAKAGELSRLYQSGVKDIRGHLEAEQRAEDAKRQAEMARLEVERLAAERAAARLTVQGLFDIWAGQKLVNRKDGGAEITRIFRKDVLPVLGSMYADEVKKSHIFEVLDVVLGRKCNRLAKVILQHLRQMFNYAVDRDWLDADPTSKIRKQEVGGKDVERDRFLSEGEIRLLAQKIPESGLSPLAAAAVWICISTSCRIGELLKARWEHIDFQRNVWGIPVKNTKNKLTHEVVLSAFALNQFQEIRRFTGHTPWIYPNRDETGHVCVKTITKQVGDRQREVPLNNRSAAVDALILPGGKWTPHDLRRTGGTLMTILGVTPEVVEKCLNHAEQNKVKRIYQRYSYAPEMAKAWALLGERLEALTSGQKLAKVIPLSSGGKAH